MGEPFLNLHESRCLQAGLDLAGLGQDHAALVVVERFRVYTGRQVRRWRNGVGLVDTDETADHYLARHITRWPTRMDPGDVLAEAADILDRPELAPCRIRYDATGIGGGVRGVVRDLYRRGRFSLAPVPVTITGGEQSQTTGTVPKLDLVTTLARLIHERRFNVAACDLAPVLLRELDGFEAKRTAAGHWTWQAASEAIHDDLVTATMLAVWRPMNHTEPRTVAASHYRGAILTGREDEPPTIVNGPRAGQVIQ